MNELHQEATLPVFGVVISQAVEFTISPLPVSAKHAVHMLTDATFGDPMLR